MIIIVDVCVSQILSWTDWCSHSLCLRELLLVHSVQWLSVSQRIPEVLRGGQVWCQSVTCRLQGLMEGVLEQSVCRMLALVVEIGSVVVFTSVPMIQSLGCSAQLLITHLLVHCVKAQSVSQRVSQVVGDGWIWELSGACRLHDLFGGGVLWQSACRGLPLWLRWQELGFSQGLGPRDWLLS